MTEWIEVLKALVDGPKLPVHGVVRTRDDRINKAETVITYGRRPLFAGLPEVDVRVWRDRARVRVELLDGTPQFITDGNSAWQFKDPESPPTVTTGKVRYIGPGSELLITRDARDLLRGDDFTQPTGPVDDVEFLGRACWAVELAPPPHKPHPLQMVIDIESGAVLEQRNDGYHVAVSYTDVVVGEPLDESLFRWDGAAGSLEDIRAAQQELDAAARDTRAAKRLV